MRVCHIITGLSVGGTEIALSRLLSSSSDSACVISLTTIGRIGRDIESMGHEVYSLNLTTFNLPVVFFRLWRQIKLCNPTIVQTWLYHADFLGGLAAKIAGVPYIVWGIRTTKLKKGSVITSAIRKLCSHISYWIPTSVVAVAEAARKEHIKIGYDAEKIVVIPNGFKIEYPSVGKQYARDLKQLLSISENDLVIGCVGRLSQVKGQDVFIKAAGVILQKFPTVKFLMVGRGLESTNQKVTALIEKNAQLENFIMLGERSDVPVCLRCMDIFCLPSRSEGLPNALGEAMLLGVPCVSTDAGDASVLGGDDVPIARVDNPEDLANKLIGMIENSQQERDQIGQRLSQRIIDEYSIEKMTNRYQVLYEGLEIGH